MNLLWPGTRVKVFDPLLYRDDKTTPLSYTMCDASIVRWYGQRYGDYGVYDDLVDVVFDHRPNEISRGHFAQNVVVL